MGMKKLTILAILLAIVSLGYATSYENLILADNPLVYYTFDDEATTNPALNLGQLGAEYNGIYRGGTALTTGVPAFGGTALSLNATSESWVDVIDTTDQLAFRGTAAFTVEFWAKASLSSQSWARFVDRGNGTAVGNLWCIMAKNSSAGNLRFDRKLVGTASYVSTAVTDGNWHYYATVFDGSVATVYMDGVSVGTVFGGSMAGNDADANILRFGAAVTSDSRLIGALDHIAIYDYVLPAAKIAARYSESQRPGAAWNAMPYSGQLRAGVAQETSVDVNLSWNTGLNQDNQTVNSNILMHYLYMSADQNVSSDTNLYLVASIPATGSTASTTISNLNFGGKYLWRIDEGINNGSGVAYPAGNVNNIKGYTWWFTTLPALPVISDDASTKVAAIGESVTLSLTATSPSAIIYTWYKVAQGGDVVVAGPSIDASSYVINNVQAGNFGQYYCKLLNAANTPVYSSTVWVSQKQLVAHWTMDQSDYANGQLVDTSGYGHNADPNEAPVFVNGQIGDGLQILSPAGDLPTTKCWATAGAWNPSENTNQMTISFWLNWAGINGQQQHFISKYSGTSWSTDNAYWIVTTNTNGYNIALTNPLNDVVATDVLTDSVNKWVHIIVAYNGATADIYVNGVKKVSGPFKLSNAAAAGINIGGSRIGSSPISAINGVLDDIRIYNYGLNPSEIGQLYYEVTNIKPCVYDYANQFDFNNDCIVNFADFAYIAAAWLDCGIYSECE